MANFEIRLVGNSYLLLYLRIAPARPPSATAIASQLFPEKVHATSKENLVSRTRRWFSPGYSERTWLSNKLNGEPCPTLCRYFHSKLKPEDHWQWNTLIQIQKVFPKSRNQRFWRPQHYTKLGYAKYICTRVFLVIFVNTIILQLCWVSMMMMVMMMMMMMTMMMMMMIMMMPTEY